MSLFKSSPIYNLAIENATETRLKPVDRLHENFEIHDRFTHFYFI